mmetsp:Transcript_38269/g.66429  ORF Transcript_38269/g.66429 Transcript_38269/m.66429 type:complete len:447 (-) Transcript_38269:355-1695(-)
MDAQNELNAHGRQSIGNADGGIGFLQAPKAKVFAEKFEGSGALADMPETGPNPVTLDYDSRLHGGRTSAGLGGARVLSPSSPITSPLSGDGSFIPSSQRVLSKNRAANAFSPPPGFPKQDASEILPPEASSMMDVRTMLLEQQRLISDLIARQRIQADLISTLRGKTQPTAKAVTKAMEQVELPVLRSSSQYEDWREEIMNLLMAACAMSLLTSDMDPYSDPTACFIYQKMRKSIGPEFAHVKSDCRTVAQIWNHFKGKFGREDQTLRAAYEQLWSTAELGERNIDQFMAFAHDLRRKLRRAGVATTDVQLRDLLWRVCRKVPRYESAVPAMENAVGAHPTLEQTVDRLTAIDVRDVADPSKLVRSGKVLLTCHGCGAIGHKRFECPRNKKTPKPKHQQERKDALASVDPGGGKPSRHLIGVMTTARTFTTADSDMRSEARRYFSA